MPLRNQLRPGKRKTFFAVCWDMVLAPRRRFPLLWSSTAFLTASQSKPACSKKRLSSLAMTALAASGLIFLYETQSLRVWKLLSPEYSKDLTAISGVYQTGTHFRMTTHRTLKATRDRKSFRKKREILPVKDLFFFIFEYTAEISSGHCQWLQI